MTKEEIKVDKQKKKYKEIYDCLMFQQCMIQYANYGNYIPIEHQI